MDKNADIFEKYKKNYRVEKSKVDRLEECFEEAAALRAKFMKLLALGIEEGNAEAYKIFENEFKSILDEQAGLLSDIGNDY